MAQDLIVQRPEGLYCPPGDFYIDPWRPVARAVITHAHSDHARLGNGHYLAAQQAEGVLRTRLGEIDLQTLPYEHRIVHQGVGLSLHPAGHVLGSAQVRLEHGGQVWVASGDYKVAPDKTCAPFEPVKCDVFITDFRPADLPLVSRRRNLCRHQWLVGPQRRGLSGVDPSIGPIIVHGAVEPLNRAYRAAGVELPETRMVADVKDKADLKRALVICPPSAAHHRYPRQRSRHGALPGRAGLASGGVRYGIW